MNTFRKAALAFCTAIGVTLASHAGNVWVDVTANIIQNPLYFGNSNQGWDIKNTGEAKCEMGIQSFAKGTWNISQSITGAPKGKYRITVNGFHRLNTPSEDKYNTDKSKTSTSKLYVDSKTVALKNIYSEYLDQNYKNGCWKHSEQQGGWWGWGWTIDYWYPNNSESAAYMLTSGHYPNKMEFETTTGNFKFGISNTTSSTGNWAAFTNWRIEYYAPTTTEGRNQLLINELQSMNIDQYLDPSWNYGGWIEVYNPTDNFIDLKGCSVSNGKKQSRLDEECIVAPKGTVCIWFDHRDSNYAPMQMDMKLDVDGGTISLLEADGSTIDTVTYPEAIARTSYARTSDGGNDWGISSTPTPASSNTGMTFATERWEEPQPKKVNRLFKSTFTLVVPIPEGATLRYTTDGTTPTASNGMTSTDGKFSISGSTQIYRFCLLGGDRLPSKVVTCSYIYKDKTFTLPILSIATKSDNLYSDDYGFFVKGNGKNGRPGRSGDNDSYNWNMDWERPVNMEYINKEGEMLISQETAMERCGGWSRAYTPFSFKLIAKKQYELQSSLPYDFFSEKPFLKHKALQMRNGGNNAETWSDGGGRIKDALLQEIIMRSGLNVDCQAYQPAVHYINGKFMGVINVREPNNKQYVYANYGLEEDEIDQFEMDADSGYVQKCGTKESFNEWYTLSKRCSDGEVYDKIKEMVDIDAYINYMAVQLYLGGDDWPHNNIKGWKPITENGKWKFVIFDLDFAFNRSTPFTDFAKEKNYTFHELKGLRPDGTPWNNYAYTKEIEFVTIFINMLQNAQFRKQFTDAYCLVAGSVFEPKRSESIINELVSKVKAMQVMANGYNKTTSPDQTANNVKNALNNRASSMITQLKNYSPMKLSSTTARKIILSSNIPEARLFLNELPIPTGRFSGQLFPPYTVRASAPAGYRFVGWTDAAGNLEYSEEEYEMPTNKALTLVARYEKMSEEEMEQTGCNSPIVINEVSAANSINVNEYGKKDDWIELYNTTDKDIDLAGMYLSDKSDKPQKWQIPADSKANTTIPAHGYKIIWCSKRESDTQLHADFKLENEDGSLVRIESADGEWADSLVYCKHEGYQTFGRYPDGGAQTFLMDKTTILASNQMTSYTMPWQYDPDNEGDNEDAIERLISHDGALALTYASGALQVRSEEATHVTLRIYTLQGMEVASYPITLEEGVCTTQVSLAQLASNLYIARLNDKQGNQVSIKIKK